jgi:hypothetical protein
VIVYDKALWRSSSAVAIGDAPPRDGVNVAQVDTITVTAAAALPIGTVYTLTLQGKAISYTTTALGETADAVVAALQAVVTGDPVLNQLVKAEAVPPAAPAAGTTPGATAITADLKLSAQTPGVPYAVAVATGTMTAVETTANVTLSPWTRIDLAAGVRWVATDADRDAILNSPRQNLIYVLTSADNKGNGALYYWDKANNKWQMLGGGGTPLKLTGGTELLSVGVPVGALMMWMTDTPPRGWLLCNGQAFDPLVYPELAKVFTSHSLPDLRGAFLRGAGMNGTGGAGAWGGAGNTVGGRQEDSTARPKTDFTGTAAQAGNHTHTLQLRATNNTQNLIHWQKASASGEVSGYWEADGGSMGTAGAHTHTVTVDGGGDAETRPKAVFCHYIAKADDAAIVLAA